MRDYEQKALDQRAAVDAILEAAGVRFTVVNNGIRKTKPEKAKGRFGEDYQPATQEHIDDAWSVSFARREKNYHGPHNLAELQVPFYTGTGRRKLPRVTPSGFTHFGEKSAPPATNAYDRRIQLEKGKPVPPDAADVLYSLLLDSSAMHMSFHDWAGDLGFDTDSISAFTTYNECCKIGREMRVVFTSEQIKELEKALEDF